MEEPWPELPSPTGPGGIFFFSQDTKIEDRFFLNCLYFDLCSERLLAIDFCIGNQSLGQCGERSLYFSHRNLN